MCSVNVDSGLRDPVVDQQIDRCTPRARVWPDLFSGGDLRAVLAQDAVRARRAPAAIALAAAAITAGCAVALRWSSVSVLRAEPVGRSRGDPSQGLAWRRLNG